MQSIHIRQPEIEDRLIPGHWEGDLIKGEGNRSLVGSLVECTTRFVVLAKIDNASTRSVVDSFSAVLNRQPAELRKSMTCDQGRGIHGHKIIIERTCVQIWLSPVINRPALAWVEAPAFMALLRQREGISARALEFLIYTAGWPVEVRGAAWPEIDVADALWTVPAERMKAGREQRVPLAAPALAVLRAADTSTSLVFPDRGGGMLSGM